VRPPLSKMLWRRPGDRHLPLPELDPVMADRLGPVFTSVERYGWHLQMVVGDPLHPPWTYTIGLFTSFGHPELAMFGIGGNQATLLLNLMAERVQRGDRFVPGATDDGVLTEHQVRIAAVRPEWYAPYFGMAIDWYLDEFPILQVVLPDRHGRFPDDPASEFHRTQPLLDSDDPWPEPLLHDDRTWEHPGPVVQARDVDELDVWSGRWEALPCRQVGLDEFEIVVVPFLGQLVLGDRVRVAQDSGHDAVVQEVTVASSYATMRVTPMPRDDEQLARCNDLLAGLDALGVRWEWAGQELFAAAVPGGRVADVDELVAPLLDDDLLWVDRIRWP
jgi:Domain of unknown function (DUF4262)/Domain of unknown function (DUF4265)